ncbi:MAG: amidohydrolase family protein [Chitinophagaceae bacterium]|nr:amidohydrolase family protein [Chitinophagaceae bacterium]
MMKLLMTLALFVCLTPCFSQEVIGKDREIVFKSVNVVPMDRESVLENKVVVVKNGKIQYIGDAKKAKYRKNAIVVDGQGRYLMPGLAEMHAHVPPNDDMEAMKDVLLLFAANGITTIRGMLGHPKHLELRSMVNSGQIVGPRFYTSGPSLSGSSAKTQDDAIRIVKEEKQAGYDFLKIHPGLTKDVFDAMARTAHAENIPFAGHVSFQVGVWKAIEARQQTIDHLDAFVEGLVPNIKDVKEEDAGLFGMFIADRVDTTRIPSLMKALRNNNVWVVPTQALAERWITPDVTAETFRNDPEMKYMDSKTLENWTNVKTNLGNDPRYDPEKIRAYIKLRRKLIYECNRNGVGLLLGCDAPQIFNVPGMSTHHELKYLVDAGLTPYEALKTGTLNVGAFYKKPTEMGVVRQGANADLVLLNANPLDNISNTTKIEGVLLGDKWMNRATLDEVLKKLEKD